MTNPKAQIEWEPTPEGVDLAIDAHLFSLPLTSVSELRDDMEEAYMQSRGNERLEVMAGDVQQYDKVYVACNVLMVSDVLTSDGPVGEQAILQFGNHHTEITLPADQQITVWRAIQ